jgi:hypothetical protein
MNKNPLVPLLIVPVAAIFPPLNGAVIAVVVGVADIRKSKADNIIPNPPLLVGGEESYPFLCSAIPRQLPGRMPTSQPTICYMCMT